MARFAFPIAVNLFPVLVWTIENSLIAKFYREIFETRISEGPSVKVHFRVSADKFHNIWVLLNEKQGLKYTNSHFWSPAHYQKWPKVLIYAEEIQPRDQSGRTCSIFSDPVKTIDDNFIRLRAIFVWK